VIQGIMKCRQAAFVRSATLDQHISTYRSIFEKEGSSESVFATKHRSRSFYFPGTFRSRLCKKWLQDARSTGLPDRTAVGPLAFCNGSRKYPLQRLSRHIGRWSPICSERQMPLNTLIPRSSARYPRSEWRSPTALFVNHDWQNHVTRIAQLGGSGRNV